MKAKKRIILSVLLGTTLAFVACEKKVIKPENVESETKHQLIQHITYQDQTYQIELSCDDNYEVVEITGDVEGVQKFQQQKVPPTAYLVEQSATDENTYNIHVFDDVAAMDAYQVKMGVSVPSVEKNCTDHTSIGGTASYRFYEHANYANELTYLTVDNQSYFQRDFYSAENDKISSLKIWGTTTGASLDIFEHGCFSGKTTRFWVTTPGQVYSVPNLTLVSFATCTDVIHDIYTNQVHIISYPCGNWNDKISSVKGWSI